MEDAEVSLSVLDQITFNTSPGPQHEEDDPSALKVVNPLVRLIAFYLPQFHAIPENDAWWGKGFTEWTNVTKAVPRFAGYYQPRLPGDLGFYDATQPDVLRRQAALARRYGIAGFCFHHYWFAGRRLLEKPLETLLKNPDIDMPFCIDWANENWTRRWNGDEKAVLLEQQHSPDDDIAFARSLEPYFRDPRYIRIMGRPLLMLYRPGVLPDAAATVVRWRTHFKEAGLGDPYITMAQAFRDDDPARYGMDAAVGFPPCWMDTPSLERVSLFDPMHRGEVVDYAAVADRTIASYATNGRVFPGVCPSWDNEARRPGRGTCFTGSTPAAYGHWLGAACNAAMRAFPGDERLVFINAWNEWAEGAYLEPDRHFGHAYLAQTARVLSSLTPVEVSDAQTRRPAHAAVQASTVKLSLHRRARRLARRNLNRLASVAEEISWRLRNY